MSHHGYNNGSQWSNRDQRRSHPYEHPNSRQDQYQGYRGRNDQGRSHFDNHGSDQYSHYDRGYPQNSGYSGGHQQNYASSSSMPFNQSSHHSDRYHERRSDTLDHRNQFGNSQRQEFSNNGRGNDFRRSMPELRPDLRPPADQSRVQSDDRVNAQPGSSAQGNNSYSGPPMDLQMRTLRVTAGNGWDFDKRVTKEILQELFIQVGPVRNIVLKNSFAFIEFQDTDSVAYALAAMDGVQLFGKTLNLEPKIKSEGVFKYLKNLRLFEERPELFGVEL